MKPLSNIKSGTTTIINNISNNSMFTHLSSQSHTNIDILAEYFFMRSPVPRIAHFTIFTQTFRTQIHTGTQLLISVENIRLCVCVSENKSTFVQVEIYYDFIIDGFCIYEYWVGLCVSCHVCRRCQ